MTTASKASRRFLGALGALLVCWGTALAHPVDELAQASFIGVGREWVSVELTLMPGEKLAKKFFASLDTNRDDTLDTAEQKAYATQVSGDLRISLDGAPLAVKLAGQEFPPDAALRSGSASIKLSVEAALPRLAPGKHLLRYENRHAPATSGYLAVVLVAESGQEAGTQTRDDRQQTLTLAFTTPAAPLSPLLSLGAGVLALGAYLAVYKKLKEK